MKIPMKGGKGKKLLLIGLLVLVGYFVVNDPMGAAEMVNSGTGSVSDAGNSIAVFVDNVGGGQS